jgi:hypothetical protein
LANDPGRTRTKDAGVLIRRKLDLLKQILSVTQQQLLLVNLDELGSLLERKEKLIEEIRRVDGTLERLGSDPLAEGTAGVTREEFARVIDATLANERTMEARLQEEQARLRGELQTLERQSRVKQYLEGTRPQGRTVDIKR